MPAPALLSPRRRLGTAAVAMAAHLVVAVITSALPAEAFEVVPTIGAALQVEVNKGRLVRLDRPAQTVFIADPEVADIQVKSPKLVYLMGRKPGETTLYAVDAAENLLASVDVSVTPNLSRLGRAIHDLHPEAQIELSSVDGALVLDGRVASASVADRVRRLAERMAGAKEAVISRLGVDAPSQVNLRVRVAEVSRDVDKQLGFNWSILGTIGGFSLGLATSNPFTAGLTVNTLRTGRRIGNLDLNTVIDALEGEGLITILAEPNLTAMSGETASFLAGGEFPILVPDANGRVTIDFKKFGVSLAFTPTLVGESQINLHVRPEVSQLSNANAVTLANFEVPSLVTRRAETTVELASGQSFAIAGLLQNNVTHNISKLPGLGEVPILGGLFRSDRFQRDESELVIIVTPYIVTPVSVGRLAAPTDGFNPPTDAGRFLDGGTHRRAAASGRSVTVGPAGDVLIGPGGFQID